ncbi:MAG: hypothetical protein ACRD0F_00810 [Acidimicrobiales bacterium]
MARIVDTIPSFEDFARRAFLESPVLREQMWRTVYERANPEVFAAFREGDDGAGRTPEALVRELSKVRARVTEAAPIVREVINQVEPAVVAALGLPPEPAPAHALLVGTMTTNAKVGRLGGEVALFHCLEWFQSRESAEVSIAHEAAHAWHQVALGTEPPGDDDLAWTTFSEGLAVQVSRAVVPGRNEYDYFWYGYPGFEDWVDWCESHRTELVAQMAAALDEPGGADAFFGPGLTEGRWRTGYYVADLVVAGLKTPLADLARLGVDAARGLVRAALSS